MHITEFIPAEWLERSAWTASRGERLQIYTRPMQMERRVCTRRTADVEMLLKSLLEKAA